MNSFMLHTLQNKYTHIHKSEVNLRQNDFKQQKNDGDDDNFVGIFTSNF